MVTHTPP